MGPSWGKDRAGTARKSALPLVNSTPSIWRCFLQCLLRPACLALSTPVGSESLRHPSYTQAATHVLTKSNVLTMRRLDVCTDVSNLHCRIRVDVPEPFGWRDDIDVVTEVRFLSLCEEVVENRDAPDLIRKIWLARRDTTDTKMARFLPLSWRHSRYCNFSQVVISTVVYCSGENPAVNIEGNTHDH